MLIKLDSLKNVCSIILTAVDSSELSKLTETLELVTANGNLCLNVTNGEYYVQTRLKLTSDEKFHATVNASVFLKLISQTTTETVELSVDSNTLTIKGNGIYKLPLIFEDDKLLALPKIDINNPTSSFSISKDILYSIYNYNSKELNKGIAIKPVQKLYYIDEKGAITFTSGACVNSFTLPKPLKLLFNNRLVKLFKLFKEDNIKFTLGQDQNTSQEIQTKVRFETSDIEVTAILPSDPSLMGSVPVQAIRNRAANTYPYSVVLNKNALLQTINRLSIFNADALKTYSLFVFSNKSVTVYDVHKNNKEVLHYETEIQMDEPYEAYLDFMDLKNTLEVYNDAYINVHFGDNTAFVFTRGSIANVIPECQVV